jgi:hypothetical protein
MTKRIAMVCDDGRQEGMPPKGAQHLPATPKSCEHSPATPEGSEPLAGG